ncbi:hypothetical protein AB8A21_09640 [Streptomyces sp. BF23-18]|uniref:hypothetical protein n=1 Tax=Streptomyces sp. BF23-18 TaxID=3240282 RepID=UPI0034E57294
MAALTATDLKAQLEQAQRDAGDLGTELARLTGELDQAAEAKDYGRAAELKRQADELRPRALLAQGQAQAIRQTLGNLREHARQERAAQVEEERQERARKAHGAAMASEKAAAAESERLLGEARQYVRAAREALRQALAAEGTAGDYRQEARQAEVDAGWQEPSAFGVSRPNTVQASIEGSALLTAIQRSTD